MYTLGKRERKNYKRDPLAHARVDKIVFDASEETMTLCVINESTIMEIWLVNDIRFTTITEG